MAFANIQYIIIDKVISAFGIFPMYSTFITICNQIGV